MSVSLFSHRGVGPYGPEAAISPSCTLYEPDVQTELNEAIAGTEKNPPEDTNFEELEARIKR